VRALAQWQGNRNDYDAVQADSHRYEIDRRSRRERESRFFISSVVKNTRLLDVMAIANGIESEALLPLLKELGVEGYQGYVTGALARIDR